MNHGLYYMLIMMHQNVKEEQQTKMGRSPRNEGRRKCDHEDRKHFPIDPTADRYFNDSGARVYFMEVYVSNNATKSNDRGNILSTSRACHMLIVSHRPLMPTTITTIQMASTSAEKSHGKLLK